MWAFNMCTWSVMLSKNRWWNIGMRVYVLEWGFWMEDDILEWGFILERPVKEMDFETEFLGSAHWGVRLSRSPLRIMQGAETVCDLWIYIGYKTLSSATCSKTDSVNNNAITGSVGSIIRNESFANSRNLQEAQVCMSLTWHENRKCYMCRSRVVAIAQLNNYPVAISHSK